MTERHGPRDADASSFERAPTVLFIEDRAAAALDLWTLLLSAGFEPRIAESGEEALWGIDVSPPDAAVVDLSRPVLDGWFVLASIVGLVRRPRVVAWSHDPADGDRALDLGADAFIHERAAIAPALRMLTRSSEITLN
jgi:two-component system KDP operon response regulator KdpE